MNIGRIVRVMTAAIAVAGGFMVVAAGNQRDQSVGSAAWNTHDMTAYASLYHDDGVWVLPRQFQSSEKSPS